MGTGPGALNPSYISATGSQLRLHRHLPCDSLPSQRVKRARFPEASGQEGRLRREGGGMLSGNEGAKASSTADWPGGRGDLEKWGEEQLQKWMGRWASQAEAFSRGRFRVQNDKKCLFKGPLVSNKPNP